LVIERDPQAHENRKGQGEDPERHPEQDVTAGATKQRLVRRLARRRKRTGLLLVPLHLIAHALGNAHELDLPTGETVLALEPEQQAELVHAQDDQPTPICQQAVQAGEEALARQVLTEKMELQRLFIQNPRSGSGARNATSSMSATSA